jgi:hypothetical protein
MIRRWSKLLPLVLAGGAACGPVNDPNGLRIDVNLNGQDPDTIRVVVSADPNGFEMPGGSGQEGVTLSNEYDSSGKLAVTLLFEKPKFQFGGKFSFVLETKNLVDLTMTASALGFAGGRLNSGAPAVTKTLPARGRNTIELVMEMRTGQIGPGTRTTDLLGETADVTILGGRPMGRLTALASCDVDGVLTPDDVVIGAPMSGSGSPLDPLGAVHVVLGADGKRQIDLETVGQGQEFHFYGVQTADALGASVACADVNGDGLGDIIAGSPGAANNAGRVYIVYGRASIAGTTIDFTNNVGMGIAILQSPTAGDRFGEVVYALPAVDGQHPAELLVSAPGAKVVHVLTPPARPTGIQMFNIAMNPHPTISGVAAGALAAGKFTGRRDVVTGSLDVAVADAMIHPGNDPLKQGVVYVFRSVDPATATTFAVDAAAPLGQSLTLTGVDKSLFGQALLALDSGMGQDLLVGAPGDADGTGRVYIYKNDSMFYDFPVRTAPDYQLDGTEPFGRFGFSLAASIWGARAAGIENLIVGAPGTSRGQREAAGAAYAYATSAGRTFALLHQIYGNTGMDRLGTAVAGGQVNSGMIGDVIVAAPEANAGAKTNAGVVYVRYGPDN